VNELPIGQKKFINLARHLRPAYVRVGGTSADCLIFDQIQVSKYMGPSSDAFKIFPSLL